MKPLRYSDLYRNIAIYLKHHECAHDFTGTRQWLERWIDEPKKIDSVIKEIRNRGAACDCEILSRVKPTLYGRVLLVVLEE